MAIYNSCQKSVFRLKEAQWRRWKSDCVSCAIIFDGYVVSFSGVLFLLQSLSDLEIL